MHRMFPEALEAGSGPADPYAVVFLGKGKKIFLGCSLTLPGSPNETRPENTRRRGITID